MRNKKWMKYTCVGLVVCILLSQVGCSTGKENDNTESDKVVIEKMEPEETHTLSFDVIGGKDVMPIAGYFGPYVSSFSPNAQTHPNFYTDEFMKQIPATGVNLITYIESGTAGERGQTLLDLCQKYGIGLFMTDSTITTLRGKNATPSVDLITDSMSLYRTHPAFCGLYLVDEPGGKDYWTKAEGSNMEDYASLSKVLKEQCEVEFYTNLIRINHKGQREQYESYLKEYCETMNPSVMMFDLYVWDEGETKTIFLYNLALARKYALEYKLPLWNYIACGTDFETKERGQYYEAHPLEGEFDWSINTSLAYGTTGINYFMLIQPHYFSTTTDPEVIDAERNGIFGVWGNKNRWYYYAQDISKQITAIDAVLMNSVNKGVIASGEEALNDTMDSPDVMIKGTSWRELADVKGDALVGCFNYQGKTALYVVNYDAEYAQDIKLSFHDNYKMQVTQDGETKYVDASSLTLKMKAGDGALIVIQ